MPTANESAVTPRSARRAAAPWMAYAAVVVAALAWLAFIRPTHLYRLESRGRGDSALAAADPWLGGLGMESRRAWMIDRRDGGRWETALDAPAHSLTVDGETATAAILFYVTSRMTLFRPERGPLLEAKLDVPGRAVLPALLRGSKAWYAAWYNRNNDRSRQKDFPYILPENMRYQFGLAEFTQITGGRNRAFRRLDSTLGVWHEETSHPWRLARDEDARMLYCLNTMSEELIGVRDDAAELFREPTPSGPFGLACGQGRCFVSSPAEPGIAVYDATTGGRLAPVPAGRGVVDLVFHDGALYALSKYERRLVTARPGIDGRWRTVSRTLAGIPSAIAWSAGRLVVADAADGTLREFTEQELAEAP